MSAQLEDAVILNFVQQSCAEKPHLLPKIIEHATRGAQDFANNQSDRTSKRGFIMTQLLDEMPDKNKFGCFTRAEILDEMNVVKGTPWHNKELEKLSKLNKQ